MTIYIFFCQMIHEPHLILEKKCKISSRGLPDLQLTPCDIEINSKVFDVCQKNNLVSYNQILFTDLTIMIM